MLQVLLYPGNVFRALQETCIVKNWKNAAFTIVTSHEKAIHITAIVIQYCNEAGPKSTNEYIPHQDLEVYLIIIFLYFISCLTRLLSLLSLALNTRFTSQDSNKPLAEKYSDLTVGKETLAAANLHSTSVILLLRFRRYYYSNETVCLLLLPSSFFLRTNSVTKRVSLSILNVIS